MPLDAYRGRIVFFSAQPGQAGLWAMDAEGGQRAYIGDSPELREQYKRAFERTQFSPDGNWRAIVQGTRETTQIYILATQVSAGIAAPRQLTRLSKLNYDPVWSPDGRRIALISQTTGRDEIWVIGVDGSGLKELTANRAFDKHPSWSPDSGRLAFWSNREGTKQIFIMDADGRNARNISNTSWDEYDPLWIR
jgi:TolB protein